MKIYSVKYCLTRGIMEHNGQVSHDPKMISADWPGAPNGYLCLHEGEYFFSLTAAIKKAREKRDKKIKSLERQIEKLRMMSFDKVTEIS